MEPANEILRGSREKTGKSEADIANEAGLSSHQVYDLESYADEVYTTISLFDLNRLCKALGITARDLFSKTVRTHGAVSFGDISAVLRSYLTDRDITIADFGNRVGWDLQDFLDNPDSAWSWNVDCLRDISKELGISWIDALPT